MEAVIITIVSGAFAGGAAWGAVKLSLNGTREDVREIKRDVKALSTDMSGLQTRVTVLEDRSHR